MDDRGRARDSNYNPFRGRGNRGRSKGRRYAGSGRSQTFEDLQQQPVQEVKQESNQQQAAPSQQKQVVIIKKEKKIDPKQDIKKTDLGNFFRDWIEGDKKNVLITFNLHFEDDYINEYQFKIEELVDLHYKGSRDEKTYSAYFQSGMKIAISLRLFRTIAQSQAVEDYKMKHFYEEMQRFEIPSSFNLILENIGKFTDEHLGNIRIVGLNMIAKIKIIEAMKLLYDVGVNEFIHTGSQKDFDNLMKDMQGKGSFIWKDRDSIKYMKERARALYEDLNKYNIPTENGLIRIPYFDFDSKDPDTLVSFINGIEKWEGKFQDINLPFQWLLGKRMNDVMASLVITNFINVNTIRKETNKLSDSIPSLKKTWMKEATWKQFKVFINLYDIEEVLTKEDLIENGFICAKVYEEYMVPLLRREIKMVELTNSQFGNVGQLIENDRSMGTNITPAYKAISPFKDKNPVVLGAVFNFSKAIRFKRNLNGFLSTTKNNIIKSLILNDLKNN